MTSTPLRPMFENDAVAVYHEPRGGSSIVITFAHLDFPYGDGRYWGKVVLERAGLSALGIVSKRNDWFPREGLLAAEAAITRILERYPQRLAYGFSMGAYAAIKHSAFVKATHVLALSPQWSIDPQDTHLFDLRLARFFDPALHTDMAIQPDDVSGRLFVLYDPYVPPDAEHAARSAILFADQTSIPVPRIGHETIDMLASSEALSGVIEAVLGNNLPTLRTLLSQRRRSNGRRLITLILALRRRHPQWANRLTERHRHELRSDLVHLLDDAPGVPA